MKGCCCEIMGSACCGQACVNMTYEEFLISTAQCQVWRGNRDCTDFVAGECEGIGQGAICYPNGSCKVGSQAEANDSGGVYQGDGTTCAGVTCDGSYPNGAICYPDGTCAVGTRADATAGGGTYQGNGTTCATVTCGGGGGGGLCASCPNVIYATYTWIDSNGVESDPQTVQLERDATNNCRWNHASGMSVSAETPMEEFIAQWNAQMLDFDGVFLYWSYPCSPCPPCPPAAGWTPGGVNVVGNTPGTLTIAT